MTLLDKILNGGIAGACQTEAHNNITIDGVDYCNLTDSRYNCNCKDSNKTLVINEKYKTCSYYNKCLYK